MALFLQLFALFVIVLSTGSTLTCRSCTDVRNVTECVNTVTCGPNEKCYTVTTGHLGDRNFTLGCKSEQVCNGGSATVGLIGRKRRAATTDPNCHQCCAVDNCNFHLCSHIDQITVSSNETCEDNHDVDCAQMSSFFPVCADIHHAKKICRKWCGLCGLVDGSWSDWSSWSSCSATCEDGHMTRTRTCTNPKPSNGGHDCIGANSDSLTCHPKTACQVNGGWGAWLPWQPCSVTQGTGLRQRERKCDSPAPSKNGRVCYGDVHSYEICNMHQPNITFLIRDVQNKDVARGANVIYKTTLVDTSGSYDNATGVFTAPVSGFYAFVATATVYYKLEFGLQIKSTSQRNPLAELYHYELNAHTSSSVTGLGEIRAGGKVWVQCIFRTGSGDILYDYPSIGQQNSFQGTLIRAH